MTSDNLNVSFSSTGTLESCAKKFYLNKFFDHPARQFESIAMSAGQVIHAAYQDYLVHGDVDQGLWVLACKYPHIHCWDSYDDRSWEACMATFLAMVEATLYNDWEVARIQHDGIAKPAIEVPFELILEGVQLPDGRGVSYIGYIDAVMLWEKLRFRSLDIKTTRAKAATRIPEFQYSKQQVPYGLIIEHISQEKVTDFQVDYLDAYVDVLEPRVQMHSFDKTQEDVRDWMVSTAADLRSLIFYMNQGRFPRAGHGCLSFFRPCKYFDLCYAEKPEELQGLLLLDAEPAEPKAFDPWITTSIDFKELML